MWRGELVRALGVGLTAAVLYALLSLLVPWE